MDTFFASIFAMNAVVNIFAAESICVREIGPNGSIYKRKNAPVETISQAYFSNHKLFINCVRTACSKSFERGVATHLYEQTLWLATQDNKRQ